MRFSFDGFFLNFSCFYEAKEIYLQTHPEIIYIGQRKINNFHPKVVINSIKKPHVVIRYYQAFVLWLFFCRYLMKYFQSNFQKNKMMRCTNKKKKMKKWLSLMSCYSFNLKRGNSKTIFCPIKRYKTVSHLSSDGIINNLNFEQTF